MPNTGTSTLLVWIQGCLAFKVLWNPHLCLLLHITVWRLPLRAWGSGPVTRPSRSIIVNLYHVSDAFRPQHTHTPHTHTTRTVFKLQAGGQQRGWGSGWKCLHTWERLLRPAHQGSFQQSRVDQSHQLSCFCCFSHLSGTFYRVTTLKNSLSPTICPPYSP